MTPAQKRALKKMQAGRRKWLASKKRRPVKSRRKVKSRRAATRRGSVNVAKKKRSGRRRVSSRRRVARRGGGGRRALGGFVPSGLPMAFVAATAGALVPAMIVAKVPPLARLAPNVRMGVEAGIVLGAGFLAKRYLGTVPTLVFVAAGLARLAAPFIARPLGLTGLGRYELGTPAGIRQLGQGDDDLVYHDAQGNAYKIAG